MLASVRVRARTVKGIVYKGKRTPPVVVRDVTSVGDGEMYRTVHGAVYNSTCHFPEWLPPCEAGPRPGGRVPSALRAARFPPELMANTSPYCDHNPVDIMR